ncbi:MAG: WG repeat-containing protein [Prevotella sp.]|nr:WG repeat-containing protein [Prevotella sp.]
MRKLYIILSLLVALNSTNVQAQSMEKKLEAKYGWACEHTSDGQKWYSVKKDGKEGACDLEGKEIVPPKFDSVIKHSYSYSVSLNKKEGIYSFDGEEIIVPRYDKILDTGNGFFYVEQNEKVGMCNANGVEIIGCEYDAVSRSSNRIEVIFDNTMGLFDENGEILVPVGKYKYIGHTIADSIVVVGNDFECEFRYSTGFRYSTQIDKVRKNGKWGIYNYQKRMEILPCKYDAIELGGDGLFAFGEGSDAYVKYGSICFRGGKWGFIDVEGRKIIPAQYDKVSGFKDGIAQVTKNGVTSLLEHPQKGTNLKFAKGSSIAVDVNIPLTNKNNDNTFAFIIANENYTHFTGADYSINDGKVFAEYCKKTLGIPEKNVRYYEDATYGNITNAVKKLQDIADVYEGDAKIIFYYSGLGAVDEKGMEKYILSTDASMSALENTGYSVNTLLKTINNLNVEYSWVVLDAPFSNLDKNGKPLASGRGVAVKSKPTHAEGKTIVTLSCSGEQTAYSSKKFGHSLFTYGLLEKLQQTKGSCSIRELNDHATSWVKKNAMAEFDRMQIPSVGVSEKLTELFNNININF